MGPLVSVIIPTYHGANSLERAVNSVLRQTYTDLEIIVVDDNDPESEARRQTEAVIASLNAPNLRYIRHEKNLNGSAARNTGIRHAAGEMLWMMMTFCFRSESGRRLSSYSKGMTSFSRMCC